MDFKTVLDSLPAIDHLQGLDVVSNGVIHHIPAIQGKLGSLRVYHALAQQFNGKLDRTCAEKGLQLLPNIPKMPNKTRKHPNIDLLLRVIAENLEYQLITKG